MESLKQLLWLAAAGISGAFIGLSMHPSERSKLQIFMFLLSGLLVAFWLTPILCKFMGLTATEEITAVAFGAGAFWSSVVEKFAKWFEARLPGKGSSKDE